MRKRKITNQEFIDFLISIGFEEKELLDGFENGGDKASDDERWFVFKDISFFIHKDGTRLIYLDVDSVSIEGETLNQCIDNALRSLRWHYERARNKLNEVKNNIKSLKSKRKSQNERV